MGSPEEEPLKSKIISKKSIKEQLQYIKENITLEPTLACYVIPYVLARLATQNLNLDKACRVNLQYGDAVCDALLAKEDASKYVKEEIAVQELVAAMETWKNIVQLTIPSLLIMFVGAWSDRTGNRKICILLPIVGDLMVCISNMINVYFAKLPVEVVMFFEAILPAITGGWITIYMGAFSYIADISSEESRTFRMGITNLCLTVGGPIGSALSGILLKNLAYYGVFGLCSVWYIFSIGYGILNIKDPERPKTTSAKVEPSGSVGDFLKSFFDMNHVKATLNVAFKKGPNHRRTKSILVLAAVIVLYGPYYGEFTIRYLYTRYRFNWDAILYSFYNTFFIGVHMLGALISISLFSKRLKWDDSVLGLISSCSKIVGALATGLARNSLEMYLAVAIETFNATSTTALRSISSKLVTSDELGKMSAVFNLTEILTSLVFGSLYSWLYMVTLKKNAGTVYFISSAITIIPVCFFVWFYFQHKKCVRKESEVPTDEKTEC